MYYHIFMGICVLIYPKWIVKYDAFIYERFSVHVLIYPKWIVKAEVGTVVMVGDGF